MGRSFGQLVFLANSQRNFLPSPSQVHCALSHCPFVRLDWLPFQYLTFGRRLSFLVSTGGLAAIIHISLNYTGTPLPCSVGICQSYRPTQGSKHHGRRPTYYYLTANVLLVASPNVARIQSRADGFSMRHADTPPPTQRAINAR